jgi:lipopolysaccharide transport system ATP-binding protein
MQDISHGGRTVLFISHDMGAIRGLCENVSWIDNGRIRLVGNACDVVGEYEQTQIRSSTNEPSFRERSEDDAKHLEFYISSVEMRDQQGRLANIFKYHEKLSLVVSVNGNVPSDHYSIEFRIYGQAGELVAMGASGAYHDIFFDKAIKRIRVEIGPLTLTNGHYLISLSLVAGTLRTDSWSNACSFHIVECQPFAHGRDLNDAVCVLQQSFQASE